MALCFAGRQQVAGGPCWATLRRLARGDGIRDQCLVGIDGNVLHGDLLLASTPMLVKPLCEYTHGTGGFFG